jgi:hypothetical protein
MIHRTRILVAITFAAALLPGLAAAQLGNCGPDVEKYCKGIPPGGGRLLRCLEGHGPQLSNPCKQAIGVKPAASGAESACQGDVMKYCRDAVGDKAKIKKCLSSHASQLSDGCKTALVAQAG